MTTLSELITTLKGKMLPLTGGTLSGNLEIGGNATVSGKNIVRSINGTVAGTDGNVTLNVSVDPLVAYPVGSIYMSVNSTNPSQLFGGTWVALNEGRVLIGASTSYPAGTTGGEATHKLTTSEMPSHSHSGSADSDGGHSHSGSATSTSQSGWVDTSSEWYPNDKKTSSSGVLSKSAKGGGLQRTKGSSFDNSVQRIRFSDSHSHSVSINSGGSHTHSVTIGSAGSGSAHNNMQPYLSVYMWKRTA